MTEKPLKILYLFNKVLGDSVVNVEKGISHDSYFFGMFRLKKHGIDASFLELEQFLPKTLAVWLRKYFLNIHTAHIPLFLSFFNYDIVFTSTAFGSLFLKTLFQIKSFKWIMLDFNIRGMIGERKTFKQKLFYWMVSYVDGIIAISSAEAEALKKLFPHLKEKIIFLHEATDVNYFSPKTNIAETNTILTVGNFGRDFNMLIDACVAVRPSKLGQDLRLIIATKQKVGKPDESLPDFVKVGQFSPEEMLKLYAEAKIVVISVNPHSQYNDSVGTLSLGEALSMGKAVIASHTNSNESYIIHHDNGLLTEHDPQSMAAAIKLLLDDASLRNKLCQSARIFALTNLDAEKFAEQLAEYFNTIKKN